MWFAADDIAVHLFRGRLDLTPWDLGHQLGRASLAVALVLVLAWGLAGIALCRAGA